MLLKNAMRHPINKRKELVNKFYDDFYQRGTTNPFAQAAGVEEIKVDTQGKTLDSIVKEILMHNRSRLPTLIFI